MFKATLAIWLSRSVNLITQVAPGELRPALWLTLKAFLLLFAYYQLKPLREALILSEHDATIRSYATAIQALVLFLLMPLYAYLVRHLGTQRMFSGVLVVAVISLALFWLGHGLQLPVAAPFYIWLGIFNVFIIAQFWAECAAYYQPEAGKRLFPLIAAGATVGGLLGAVSAHWVFIVSGVGGAFAVAISGYVAVWQTPRPISCKVAQASADRSVDAKQHWFRGLNHLLLNPYLMLIALFVLLLNTGNSLGEYILARWVELQYSGADQIGAFYGGFYSWVNFATVLCQLFLVSRMIRWLGVSSALLLVPCLMLGGYLTLFFLPLFWLTYLYKVAENSLDYSLQNTLRHTLFLPLSGVQLYEGKAVIDTIFWRLGDLIQLVIVLLGSHWLLLDLSGYLLINVGLALVWIWICLRLQRHIALLSADLSRRGAADPGA
ncbi:hypothetical protein DU002_15430 [Corallincola holothuriorum]|uniref:ADP,ATP carrier protein n=1 Tax=Corallincola holothuriorum TaxID=2282215 RepID=A0A368N4M6_9GAMM|nr:hypothetical protein DU002_15430 [Corallincola holothuriorum]